MELSDAIRRLVDSGIDPETADALVAQTSNWDGLTDGAQRERVVGYIEDQRQVRAQRIRDEHTEAVERAWQQYTYCTMRGGPHSQQAQVAWNALIAARDLANATD